MNGEKQSSSNLKQLQEVIEENDEEESSTMEVKATEKKRAFQIFNPNDIKNGLK